MSLYKSSKTLSKENKALKRRVKSLEKLCDEKDAYFTKMISDGMRHGS